MKRKEGIIAALDNKVSLENKIAMELEKVLSDNTLKERYTDPQDKQNVVQRELIIKALEIIYEHNSEKFKIVQISDELDPLGELFGALRCLRHDTKRLNEGMGAERVAKPVIRESITRNEIILIDRKLRILWYVASELHTNADKDLFKTQKALEEHAATILDSTPDALKTGRSQLKSKGDATEQEFFYKHINKCKQLSKESGGQISPLRLLLPALEALSRD